MADPYGVSHAPAVGVLDQAASAERLAAQEARVAECLAAGMSERAARMEGVRASADCRRAQLGLAPEPDTYVPPKERYRVTGDGRVVGPKGKR